MKNPKIILPYSEAKNLIEEADVLLFRAGSFPSVGWWITAYTRGLHSHVGLAHLDGDDVYCIEQREFKGGRSVILDSQVKKNPNTIDVYRAAPCVWKLKSESDGEIIQEKICLNDRIRHEITRHAGHITGSPYGWANIWEIFKAYAPGLRLVYSDKNGDDTVTTAHVCSTLVNVSYRLNYADPCPNLKDARTTPADIAQSALFHYLFTIGEL